MNLFKRISLYILLFSLIVPTTDLHAGKGNGFALTAGGGALVSYLTAAGITIALGPVGLFVAGGATVVGFTGLLLHNKKKSQGSTPQLPLKTNDSGGGNGSFGFNNHNDDDKNRKIFEQAAEIEKSLAAQREIERAREVAAASPTTPTTPVRPAPEMPAAKPTPANSTEVTLGTAKDIRTGVNKALEVLGPQDNTGSLPHIGKMGATKDLIAGRSWSTKGIRSIMRLDWAPKQGLHINIEGYNHAKQQAINGIIKVPGTAQTLSNYLKHLNTPASMTTAINALKLAAETAKSGAQYASNAATRITESATMMNAGQTAKLFNATAQTARWIAQRAIGF